MTGISGKIEFISHGYIAVDLFFVLSGFVMALSYQHIFADNFSFASYRKFLGRRIARIYPIYFVTTIAALALIYFGLDRTVSWNVASGKLWAVKFVINGLLIQAWGLTLFISKPSRRLGVCLRQRCAACCGRNLWRPYHPFQPLGYAASGNLSLWNPGFALLIRVYAWSGRVPVRRLGLGALS
jgi:hypothetical protein